MGHEAPLQKIATWFCQWETECGTSLRLKRRRHRIPHHLAATDSVMRLADPRQR